MPDFDPYHRWLGIPPDERPISKYRLLALGDFEGDRDVITLAAERQTVFLRTMQAGEHANLVAQLLNEVSQARVTLLDPDKKSDYDAQLRNERTSKEAEPAAGPPPVVQPTVPVVNLPTPPRRRTASNVEPKYQQSITKLVWKRPKVTVLSAAGVIASVLIFFMTGNSDVAPLVTEYITNTIGMTLSKIPGGTFVMGSPEGEKERKDDEQQHEVTISKPFYMQTTEVTQGQWKTVMGTEPWTGKQLEGANYAATWISWEEAAEFCKRLSEIEGDKYRLPTEAEWEYACRGETETAWSFGDNLSELTDYAWYRDNTGIKHNFDSREVGLKASNPFGLYDMHGNVWEWCFDRYDSGYYEDSPRVDPQGPTQGASRVIRSGSGGDVKFSQSTRSASRNNATVAGNNVGFRVVRELD